MSEESRIVTNRVPFFMLLSTILLRGSIFLLLNAPILYHLIRKSKFSGFGELIEIGIVDTWKSILSTQTSWPAVSVFLLVSLIVGWAFIVFQGVLSGSVALAVEFLNFVRKQRSKIILFSPFSYRHDEYRELMDWLAYNPRAQIQWEWQQFFYHGWWSLTTNLVFFIVLSVSMLGSNVTTHSMIVLVTVALVFLLNSLYHSWHMGRVHCYYIVKMNVEKMKQDIDFK
jgi:hypothetical protein